MKRKRSKTKTKPKTKARTRRRARIAGEKTPTRRKKGGTRRAKVRTHAKARTRAKKRTARPRKTTAPPPPAFPQAAGAPAKQQLLFRIVKARATVLAAIQGMTAATAEQPLGEGKWSSREVVLHLVTRDRVRLREMEAALRGIRPSWDGADAERQTRINEEDLAPLRPLGWDESLRLLNRTRQELMEAVESIPEEPSEVWAEEHPLGWMFQRLPPHDLHHADQIKRWRTKRGV